MEKSKQAYKKAMMNKDEDRVTMKDIKKASRMSGGMAIGGGHKNYKMTGQIGKAKYGKMMKAKTGKLVGKQKNLPKHLQEKILA